jgi:hypothetical protein
MSDFDVLGLLLLFAVLGAGVLIVLKFIARRMHHGASPYSSSPGGDTWIGPTGGGKGDGATGA